MNHTSTPVDIKRVSITGDFWAERLKLISKAVLAYQWELLNDRIPGVEPSHAVENFKIAAGEVHDEFKGMLFQDSDVAKWFEAASYSLASFPNNSLEKELDDLVDLMERAQRNDGYLNTYFIVAEPEKRWTDFSFGHELYCAGHLIEAAVAYFSVTGKRKFLDLMCRYIDYVDSVIGPEKGKLHAYDGHPEIELALVKLYRATGEKRYLNLASYFIDERGRQPVFLREESTFAMGKPVKKWFEESYYQTHLPVRSQTTAEGHAVRAMYLFSAMADIALETDDATLLEPLHRLWGNTTSARMYVTGALGSQAYGERFTIDFDLPNDSAYSETCASIGLVLWASRMLRLETNRKYADVLERVLYNGVLSGLSLDGKRYFYVNPLEVVPKLAAARKDLEHIATERVPWFGCSCCPPNIARLITSIGTYLYTVEEDLINVHLYASSRATLTLGDGKQVMIEQKTRYPLDGSIDISLYPKAPGNFTLSLRIPGWCGAFTCRVNGEKTSAVPGADGYLRLLRGWAAGDVVKLDLGMEARFVWVDPRVREDIGKVAIQRGPIVYCLEEADNGKDLYAIAVSATTRLSEEFVPDLLGGIVVVRGQGSRADIAEHAAGLYGDDAPRTRPFEFTAIPYALWCNRSPGEMVVWLRTASL